MTAAPHNPSATARRLAEDLGGRRRLVRVDQLRSDPAYQRPPDREKVQALSRQPRVAPILVNHRQDGELYVIDGQHRAASRKARGMRHVSAWVVTVPSSEEARLFAELNTPSAPAEDNAVLVKSVADIDRLINA